MRICSPQLGLAPQSILGGEVFDRQILLGLAKKGVKIEIILPKNKPYDKKIKNWRMTFIPISHFPAALFNLLVLPYLYSAYQRRKFEILRLHQPQFTALGCFLFKIFHQNIKLVASYHQFKESNFGPFSKPINHFWDHIICDSQFVKNQIIKKYQIPSKKISIVHNGVPSYLKPSKKNETLLKKLDLENKIVLLFMGLFIQRKNPLFLLNVLHKLIQKNSNIVLIFWGTGPLQKQIIQKAKELSIFHNIRIQKPLFDKAKNKIHNLADIFVHPARDEGFALAPLEAMACAKPVVITKAYSAKEAIDHGVNGLLCRPNDLQDWAYSLEKLITDKQLRERMGEVSLLKVKKEFQWKIAIMQHVEVFNKLIS